MFNKLSLLFLLFCIPFIAYNQFSGGISDGYAKNTITQSTCPPELDYTNVFYGGLADGHAKNTITQSTCPPEFDYTNVFYGGSSDGFSFTTIVQSTCPPELDYTNVFFGGIADGHAKNTITQSTCPPELDYTNVFYGGSSDGFSFTTIIQSTCPPELDYTNVFFGGIADGHAKNSIIQTSCPPELDYTNVFSGGISDGFALTVYQQTICSESVPLSINLTSWQANCENNRVELLWQTASEMNNSHFEIERSTDGLNWSAFATITGAGNSLQSTNYSINDSLNNTSVTYYRLRQVDFDGGIEMFSTISVSCFLENQSILIFPNPTNGNFTISGLLKDRNNEIKIYDSQGKLIFETNSLEYSQSIDLLVSPGIYNLVIQSYNSLNRHRIVFF